MQSVKFSPQNSVSNVRKDLRIIRQAFNAARYGGYRHNPAEAKQLSLTFHVIAHALSKSN